MIMPQNIDAYYLIEERNSRIVLDFLEKYFGNRKELSENYPLPQYSDNPKITFSKADKLMEYLDKYSNIDYLLYWENLDDTSEMKFFTLQYTDDGKMIFGISFRGNKPNTSKNIYFFQKFKKILKSKIGCLTIEEPPPSNSDEFVMYCNQRFSP